MELFDEVFDECEMESSPGYPYVWQGISKNRQIAENLALKNAVKQRYLELWRVIRAGEKLPNPVVRDFVKNEGHKLKKIREKRWRLIWALPLEWQLLHRTAFGASLAMEQANHETIPTKDGLSLIRGGANRFVSDIDDGSDKIGDRDLEGWDLSVPEWLLLDESEVRKRLCLNLTPFVTDLIDRCYRSLLNVHVIFSDGTLLEQLEPGIVKSGSYITLSGNSRMQVLLKILYCDEKCGGFVEQYHKVAAIGDDSLERMHGIDPADFQQWLTDHGFKCKDFNVGRMSEMTFCSHKFIKYGVVWVPVPTNWIKHQFTLSCKPKNNLQFFREQLSSLMLEYAFADNEFAQLSSTLARVDPSYSFSQEWAKEFVLGFESEKKRPDKPAVRVRYPPSLGFSLLAGLLCLTTCEAATVRAIGGSDMGVSWLPLASLLLAVWTLLIAGGSQRFCFLRGEDHSFGKPHTITTEKRPFGFAQPVFGPLSAIPTRVGQAALDLSHRWDLNPFKQIHRANRTKKIEGVMTKHKKTGPLKGAAKKKMVNAAARTAAKAAVAAAKAVASKHPKKGGGAKHGGKPKGAGRLAFLKANRFNMDTARFGGRDLVAKIVLSATAGGAGATAGTDKAGTVLYKTQIRPQKFIPNTRLGKMMALFMKWRLMRARFTFKSSLPAGSNAGTLLMVHEPDPNEETPAEYAAPSAATLSNYDSHSTKAVIPMAQVPHDFKGERNESLDLKVGSAVGPGGGWFVLDPEDVATPIENSMGQFMILVQDAHNVMGASGGLPNTDYEIGSLFFEYDIEVQTASDNGGLGGGYSNYGFWTPVGKNYANVGAEAVTTVGKQNARLIVAQPPATGNFYVASNSGVMMNGVQTYVQWDGTHTYFWFNTPGVFFCEMVVACTPSDVGTSEAHMFNSAVSYGNATVLNTNHNDLTTIAATSNSYTILNFVVLILDPETDGVQIGTTSFTTTTVSTTQANGIMRVIALPEDAVLLFKKEMKKQKEEEKTVDDMKERLEGLFERWARARGMLPPAESKGEETLRAVVVPSGARAVLPAASVPDIEDLDKLPALIKCERPVAVREERKTPSRLPDPDRGYMVVSQRSSSLKA